MNKKMSKKLNTLRLPLIAVLIVVSILAVISYSVAKDARNIGRTVGSMYGNVVGNMKGSIDGNKNGSEEGKKAAEIPADPTIDITTKMQQQGKLHVLQANLTVNDVMTKAEDPNFAVLFSEDAVADYSVDMTKINVIDNGDSITVIVPDVQAEYFKVPNTYIEIERYGGQSGSSKEGNQMYIDSQKRIHEEIIKEINEEGVLKQQAREAARKQIRDLAHILSGVPVEVKFETESGEQ